MLVHLALIATCIAIQRSVTLEQLSWMSGYWTGTHDATEIEEIWLPPKGGLMLGSHRDVFGNGKCFFEYLRIESGPTGLVYLASPKGNQPTTFTLKSLTGNKVVFENLEHDFPQRIIYWMADSKTLCARVEGEVKGVMRSEEWKWKKASLKE